MRGRSRRFAALIAVSATASLTACAAGSSGALDQEVALRDDTFRPYREYATGRTLTRSYPNVVATELIARVDRKTGATTTLLHVVFTYTADHMRRYESARDARAEALHFEKLSRNRSCEKRVCVYEEIFTIDLREAELRRAPAGGYQLKVFTREGGEATLTVANAAIERLLAALDGNGVQEAARKS